MKGKKGRSKYPIAYWSYSSLMSYLRNPLAFRKRYIERIYDTPRTPASIVGSAGHVALEHFYSGAAKDIAIRLGKEYIEGISDFEINFGRAKTKKAQKAKRAAMLREYHQAIGFYLGKAPRHLVVGVEVKGVTTVTGHALPIKAISDLVVESKSVEGALDIVDHKFVESFSSRGAEKPLYALQAIFNYYTVRDVYGKPVERFLVYECKKSKNADGKTQLRRYIINYKDVPEAFEVFHRLLRDATKDLAKRELYLPNPSDMFEGENSFDLYRLRLGEE